MTATNSADTLEALQHRREALAVLKAHADITERADLQLSIEEVDEEIAQLKSPKPKRFMTWAEYKFEVKALASVIADNFKRLFSSHDALQARVDALEAKMENWKHIGPYDSQTRFKIGNHVTHGGSSWICKRDCQGVKPGESGDWQMTCKRGRDADR